MAERNNRIIASIEAGRVPMLRFELAIAKTALGGHVGEQEALGQKLGEMMRQSSETWHDNAPAEAIASASMVLAASAERTIQAINNAEVFDNNNDDDSVTLGSIVEVHHDGDDANMFYVLTGMTREIPDDVSGIDKLECVTVASPLGKALFDKRDGDRVGYSVNGRVMYVDIISIYPALSVE